MRLGVRVETVESGWMPRMVTEWLAPSLASCLKPFVGASSQISTAQHFGDNRNPDSYWPPQGRPAHRAGRLHWTMAQNELRSVSNVWAYLFP